MPNLLRIFNTGVPAEVLHMSAIMAVLAIILGLLLKVINQKGRYVLWVLLVEYLFVVACVTVICRSTPTFVYAKLELMPFWTYQAILNHTPQVTVRDIIRNLMLFLLLGFLVKLLFPKLHLGKMLLIAVACYICIETSQYLFEKGIAQIDDVMHNAIGSMIGWGVAKVALGLMKRKEQV